jgi:small subunit ribosomal protein S18
MADDYSGGDRRGGYDDRRRTAPPPGGDTGEGGPPQAGGRRRYTPRRKVCMFCADKIRTPDYKDIKRLQRHVSDRGKILPRRRTGACARHQRGVATAVKRARHMALLPFVAAPGRG